MIKRALFTFGGLLLVMLFLFPLSPVSAAATHHASASSATMITPNIAGGPGSSCNNDYSYTYIYYNGGGHSLCFGGDGYYLGSYLPVNNVTGLTAGVNCGWIRYYDSTGGYFKTFNTEQYIYFSPGVYVTQIDIQGQGCIGSH